MERSRFIWPTNHQADIRGKASKVGLKCKSHNNTALFDLYLEGFFQEEEALKKAFESDIAAINTAFSENNMELLQGLHQDLFRNQTPITS